MKNILELRLQAVEEARNESERILYQIQSVSRSGYYVTDIKTGIWKSSAILDEIFGIDESFVRNIENWSALIVPEYRQKLVDYYYNVIQVKSKFTMDYKIIRPSDGQERWVLALGEFDYDADGNPLRQTGIIHDITARKQMEESLRRSEEQFRKLFEGHSAAMLVIDPETGDIFNANNAAAQFYGWSVEALKQMRIQQINTLQSEIVKVKMNEIKTLQQSRFEFVHRMADATLRDVEVFCNNIMIAEKEYVYSIIHDITARKRAVKDLQDSEAKFRLLFQTLPLPLIIINQAEENQIYFNECFAQVFGYASGDLFTIVDWRRLAYPDEKYRQWVEETWSAAIERARCEGRNIQPMEVNITCRNGMVRTVVISGIAIEDGYLEMFTDITERLRHEQTVKNSYERRRKNDLMNELIQASIPSRQSVYEIARIMGEKALLPFSCLLILIDEYQGKSMDYWQENLVEVHLLKETMLDALEDINRISWDSPDGIGVICFESDTSEIKIDKQKSMAEQLRKIIAGKVPDVIISIGISEPSVNMADIGTYYRQACTAANAGRKVWPRLTTYHYLDMGIFQLLSCFTDGSQIAAYIDRTVGKVLNYDKRKNEVLLDTLESILMSDNLKESADKLCIHYKTLLFRKRKLEKILEVSLDDFSSRLAIITALQLLKLKKD